MAAMPIVFDATTEPIYIVKYVGQFSDGEWQEHIGGFARILGCSKPYAAIVDNLDAQSTPSAPQRQAMTQWLRLNAASLKTFCRGVAFVHTSPFVRGALTAIHWVAPAPYSFTTFASTKGALEWCRKRLAGDAAP